MQMINLIAITLIFSIATTQQLTFSLLHDQFAAIPHQKHSLQAYDLTSINHPRLLRQIQLSSIKQEKHVNINLITDGFSFRIPMEIGGVHYEVNLDTGSSDFMVKGEQTTGQPQIKYKCRQHNCKKLKDKVMLGYLDGFLSAYVVKEEIEFGEQEFKAEVLIADTQFQTKFDTINGICGISFPELASHQPNLIQTLIHEKIIEKYAYGINFNFLKPERSFINFGQSNPRFYEGELIFYPIVKQRSVTVDFNYFKAGNSQEMHIDLALLDTGTTCISVPERYEDEILGAFHQSNSTQCFFLKEVVPSFKLLLCRVDDFDSLPVLSVTFNETEFIIEKQNYLQMCYKQEQSHYCVTYIESYRERKEDIILLGDGFFRRYYTFFDLQGRQVGIGKNRESNSLEEVLNQEIREPFDPNDWTPIMKR